MTSSAHMGAAEANALIGRWYNLVGSDVQFLNAPPAPAYAPPVYAAPVVYARGRGRGHYGNEAVRREVRREGWRGAPAWGGRGPGWRRREWLERKLRWEQAYPGQVFGEVEPVEDVQVDAQAGNWYNIVGRAIEGAFQGFPPRNGLQERGAPTRSDREILPMSTGGTKVPFGVSAQITSRPQRVAFRPERVMISNGGTTGGAADWIVNDISIGNRSQFAQSGQVPGDMFAINAVDSFISFETAQTAMDIVMTVTYVGLNVDPGSCAFYGSILGTSALY